jgi:hypothetical protein
VLQTLTQRAMLLGFVHSDLVAFGLSRPGRVAVDGGDAGFLADDFDGGPVDPAVSTFQNRYATRRHRASRCRRSLWRARRGLLGVGFNTPVHETGQKSQMGIRKR